MDDKQAVQVTIFHQNYTLRTAGDERELMELADSVDQLMQAIAARSQNADAVKVAVLASIHLADRLRTLESELASLKQRVEEKSARFRLLLDQVIDER